MTSQSVVLSVRVDLDHDLVYCHIGKNKIKNTYTKILRNFKYMDLNNLQDDLETMAS